MGNQKNIAIKRLLLVFLIGLLSLPFLQARYEIFQLKPLKGVFVEMKDTSFNYQAWKEGSYQTQKELFLKDHIGLKQFFVRMHNEVLFQLFRKSSLTDIIVGKKDYLYDQAYVDAATGRDYMGEDKLRERMWQIKFIQDTLEKMNKHLIVILAPGKASFFPEYLPSRYQGKKSTTNYETVVALCREMGIRYLDFRPYFLKNKNHSPYPLYPQCGVHWSIYGLYQVLDSTVKYVEWITHTDLPEMVYDSIEVTSNLQYTDYEIGDIMNLFSRIPTYKMAYPHVHFLHEERRTVRALAVADSYFGGIFGCGLADYFFLDPHYWSYYKEYFLARKPLVKIWEVPDLKSIIDQHDVIFLSATEINVGRLGWNFIPDTYNMFKGIRISHGPNQKQIDLYIRAIRADAAWLESVKEKAIRMNVSLDSMIRVDARYMAGLEMEKENKRQYAIERYKESIRNNADWLNSVKMKARARNIPVDSMITIDAASLAEKEINGK